MVKIEERSVYDHIANFLREKFNAKVLTEGGVGSGYVDVVFSFDSLPFVMEVKLGRKEKKLAEAVAQGYKYAQSINTRNVIALVLTQLSPGQEILIEKLDKLPSIILGSKVEGYVHTEYLEKWVENITLQQVLEEIYERTIKKEREVDPNSIIKAIGEIIEDLYEIIRQARTDEIFEEVVKKLELFVGIGEIKDKEKVKSQINMLASYLLFNQILFYHIYKTKTNNPELKPLSPITSLKDLQKYFDDLKRIDYRPIYSIELIDKIPEKLEIIDKINMVIKNVLVIRTEHISKKDLAGRFFHALLPKEVAKVWAAFYTHPVAAEILANLAIDRWDEKVIDPACGSGTLLAASYQRKLDLYKEKVGRELTEEEIRLLHKKFLEKDITGIDIMPFAAHLTAINLSAQHLEATTNFLRIACMDSLELAPQLKSKDFVEKGILIKSFSKELQKTLTGLRKLISREGALSLAEEKSEFRLTPVDAVIMNPPFSDREKLPKDYLEKLSDNSEFGRILGNICGHQINLWGYFLALADMILKPNGKIAAVIPINIARGKATEKIRNHLLENYHIRYIIKTTKDLAFSESAAFRDILLVVEKRRPKENDETCIIFLNKSIREIKENEIKEIIKLKSGIEIRTIEYSELIRYKDNLMPLLYSFSLKNAKIINNFLEICFNRRPTLFKKLEETEIRFPHSFRPTGASEVLTITKKTDESRIKRALLLSIGEGENFIEVEIKHTNIKFKIPTKKLQYLLRTITGVGKLELTKEMMDYLIIEKYDEFDRIVKLSKEPNLKWNRKLEETINGNLKTLTTCCIPDKINLVSPNTKLIAFHSNKKFVVGSTICAFLTKNIESSKLMTLFFNSVISLAQILQYKSETQGAYTRMTIEDWLQFKILDVSKLEKERKILLELFKKLKDVEFPSILEQLEKRFWARVELDKTILKILGFSDEEIDYWLPRVYDAIVEELKAMKKVK